jgi:hypothetical protein
MSVAFVTSLRHPDNSASYDRVEALLERTLGSVAGQTATDFSITVVGNRRPSFRLPARTTFVEVDFPAPAPPTGPHTARTPFVWDKGTKIGVGIAAVRDQRPDHVMVFDADDFVHRELVAYVGRHPATQGWVVADGIMYSALRNAYRPIGGFHRTCGTCFVIPYGVYAVPDGLGPGATQAQVEAAYGERLWRILGAHRDAHTWFAEHGIELAPLPYPGAAYHVDTGENHSGKSMTGLARPLGRRVARDLGIEPTRSGPGTLWSAVGPTALYESARLELRRRRR